MKLTAITTTTALLLGSAAMAQQTITINIGSSHPEANIWVYAMKNTFQPEVNRILSEAGGDYQVNWSENYAGTLYKFTDTREAVMDGIVDIGMVGTVWEGANMPLQNVTYFTPFATEDHRMLIEIFDDLSQSLPELRDSWSENGMVHLSSLITDSYDIYATFPVTSMEDLQNRKLNAPGTSANWLRETGATPVDGALTTYYTNIQTGVTEGTLSFASGILPTRVYEVAPELTRVGIGSMYFGGIAANEDFFNGLPEPVQTALREAAQATSIAHGDYVADLAARALEEMQAAGLTIHELPAEEKAKWVESLPNIIEPWLEQTGEAGKTVLKAYFDALRERGATPARDWDAGL
ncbi:TRAP transporter - DctP subunit precursor (plasmid) [Dinoroseobacter shibae DFL 12 = DSM 16493]|jgi:TRAP-type C4-dicarboxylate transport system substrate-binding protein|uniref:TRAP transporter-DctP subunit n=1 Tax=Dinoroseobacter shibae (strain DSM 16493 / NCIMB 14021 / DFL 12) TaxID=398580 RepID=A8LUJ6_DINSH|nr:C4-dicarboxylate TRAP transporter substrate-binding protein [Dinoroseobacter shibae]ABV95913.1 TRAP transporter - DctP subunit precursor [Dinoroseobacter shibae DFL 12 = DSM 16493]URF49155.1 C4-dicarboxylate TRAP transporter substrate-binding protein [Dinoroseobacter shibae]URF53463.1 C4-dicarboxylate TRAP transporter substrate-binding protein [Dinoroseobacter shibae]